MQEPLHFLWPQHASQSPASSAKQILNVLLGCDPTAWPRKGPGSTPDRVSPGEAGLCQGREHTLAEVCLLALNTSCLAEEPPGLSELGFPVAIPASQTWSSCSSPGWLMTWSRQRRCHPRKWARDARVTAPWGHSGTSYRQNASPCSTVQVNAEAEAIPPAFCTWARLVSSFTLCNFPLRQRYGFLKDVFSPWCGFPQGGREGFGCRPQRDPMLFKPGGKRVQ